MSSMPLFETDDQLHEWISRELGLRIPRVNVCANHCAPFDYVRRAYFEPSVDQIVWAPRGGGKTTLAAVVTLLDLLHKPGISVRILGGSLEQSLRLWESLIPMIERVCPEELEKKRGASRKLTLSNHSTAAVLTQSQKSVRGLRVQKLRCDEVELFDPEVWSAAQLVTRSRQDIENHPVVRGAIDALSTLHSSVGLMGQIVDNAAANRTPVVKWCILDVLQKCPAERSCETCPLWTDCQGVAKTRCDGFVSIDDAIAMKSRVSDETWAAEMLCQRPSVRGRVFPTFDPTIHLREESPFELEEADWSLGIDFGFHNPFVCLWIVEHEQGIYVIDEYVQDHRTVADHLEEIQRRDWPRPRRVACDPAGSSRNDQTARSNVELLKLAGYRVKTSASRIVDGIEHIRSHLRSATSQTRLWIHPRCKKLITAIQSYRYPQGGSEVPDKDGVHDHPIDALRYYFVNRGSGETPVHRAY